MSLSKVLAGSLIVGLGLSLVSPSLADARKKKVADESAADEESADDEAPADEESSEDEDARPKKGKTADEADEADDDKPVKQNLSGHDGGTTKKKNEFEKDRFFVDKIDSEKTAKGTLIQGSLQSTTFGYTESGGNYGTALDMQGKNGARFSRLYTELRLQTDFRHISASRWDARIDARARFVKQPAQKTPGSLSDTGTFSDDPNHVQSGFNGTNELDLRELWLFHSGKRTDFFLGRQFIPDLGGVKFDGLRLDYAKSRTFTLIGFGGLYPVRGSRSLTTDYKPLKDADGNDAGKLVGAGGFGAAYRTNNAYGAFGGVALVPVQGEQPRIFATSTGYWRYGSKLDVYHFALLDLYSSQTVAGTTTNTAGVGIDFTNLSGGLNYKPNQRLRLTASYNRVDIDTLAVQAYAFLDQPEANGMNVQNDTFFRRLATTSVRGGVSAGLGELNRFEVSLGAAYRYRKTIRLPVANNANGVLLQGTRGVELTASLLDRHSFKDTRLGLDVTRTFGLSGDNEIAFMRSEVFAGRLYAARDLANGHGEWEAEVSYSTTKDSASGTDCQPGTTNITQCYGSSTGSILSVGGNVFYRINRDWFALGTLFLSRQQLDTVGNVTAGAMPIPKADPGILGFTGFFRIAYRF